jgi:hypothetical protein
VPVESEEEEEGMKVGPNKGDRVPRPSLDKRPKQFAALKRLFTAAGALTAPWNGCDSPYLVYEPDMTNLRNAMRDCEKEGL